MKCKNIILVIFLFLLLSNSISFIFINIDSFEKEIHEKSVKNSKLNNSNTNTTILRPNGDILTEWDGDPIPHWSKINEIESSPNEIYIRWIDGDENQSEIFAMEDLEVVSINITKIEVYILGFRYWTGVPNVSIYLGEWTTEIEVNLDTNMPDKWRSCSWSYLTGTPVDLLNLQVKITASDWCSGPPTNGYARIDILYCNITYDRIEFPPSKSAAIPGYNLFLMISVIFIISVVIIDNRYRFLKNK